MFLKDRIKVINLEGFKTDDKGRNSYKIFNKQDL